jgi:hypothetical protein
VPSREPSRRLRRPRQQLEERAEALEIERPLWRNCHRIGPSLCSSLSTPEAKKFASGASMSRSFFMWVMKREPLTANTNPSGVSACQRANESGRWRP